MVSWTLRGSDRYESTVLCHVAELLHSTNVCLGLCCTVLAGQQISLCEQSPAWLY